MKAITRLLLGGLLMLLAGCGASGQDEVHEWMVQQRSRAQARPLPLPAPRVFEPEPYRAAGSADPFGSQRLTQVLKTEGTRQTSQASLLGAELSRSREQLESYPLDAMSVVGVLVRDAQTVALVRVDRLLYPVRVGQYLGQNFGRVQQITESGLTLREVVQDPSGEWVARSVTLHLQEKPK